jgi:DNA-binding transcriptional regulator YhcF (GntR family)
MMTVEQQLAELIHESVIPDIEERMDELYTFIADKKNSSITDAKKEIEELSEFREDLKNVLIDIECGEMSEEECQEMLEDILSAQEAQEDE